MESGLEGGVGGSLNSPASPIACHSRPTALCSARVEGSCASGRKTGGVLGNGDFHSWASVPDFLPGGDPFPARPCPKAGAVSHAGGRSCHRNRMAAVGMERRPIRALSVSFSHTIELLSLTTSIWNKSASRLGAVSSKTPSQRDGKNTVRCRSPERGFGGRPPAV